MPWFVCYRGRADYLALSRTGFFEVTDSQGRLWLCHEATEEEVFSNDAPADFMAAAFNGPGPSESCYRSVNGEREQLPALLGQTIEQQFPGLELPEWFHH